MARPGPKGHSDEFKAMALAAASTDARQNLCARDLGIAKQTLSRWVNGKNITQEVIEMAEEAKEVLAAKLDEVGDLLVSRMSEKLTKGDIEKMSIKDLAIAYGVMFDKSRLARGEATSITGTTDKAKESLEKKLGKLNRNLTHGTDLKVIDGGADGNTDAA